MSCAICFSEITEATGRTVLGCKHEFHLRCIATWFGGSADASCPCCRTVPGEHERLSDLEEGEEEEDEDDDYSNTIQLLNSSFYNNYPHNATTHYSGWRSFRRAEADVITNPDTFVHNRFIKIKQELVRQLESAPSDIDGLDMSARELTIYRDGLFNMIATMTLCGITG